MFETLIGLVFIKGLQELVMQEYDRRSRRIDPTALTMKLNDMEYLNVIRVEMEHFTDLSVLTGGHIFS